MVVQGVQKRRISSSFFRGETCLYWTCCIPIDNWVKSIVYIGLSIPFFVPTWLLASIRTDVIVIGRKINEISFLNYG